MSAVGSRGARPGARLVRVEILRLRCAPLRMTKGRGSAQDDKRRGLRCAQGDEPRSEGKEGGWGLVRVARRGVRMCYQLGRCGSTMGVGSAAA